MSTTFTSALGLELATAGTSQPWLSGALIGANMTKLDQQFARIYNVRGSVFGAVGDGVADDTSALQSALDAAHNAGSGLVVIPPGSYSIAQSTRLVVRTGVTIWAYGAYLFKAGSPTNGIVCNFATGVDSFPGYSGNANITILGGTWDARGYNAATNAAYDAIDFNHGANIRIEDVEVWNTCSDHALEFNSTTNAIARNCRFLGFFDRTSGLTRQYSEAVQIDAAISGGSTIGLFDNTHSQHILVEGCYAGPGVDGNGGTAFGKLVGSHSTATGFSYNDIKILGNTCDGALDCGIGAYNWTNSVIAGNVVLNTASHGIRVTVPDPAGGTTVLCTGIDIRGNIIDTTQSGAHGIEILGYSSTAGVADINIHGNIIKNAASIGIFCQLIYRGLSVHGNNVYASGSNSINFTGCQGAPQLKNNYIYHPASNYGIFVVQYATGPVLAVDVDVDGNTVMVGTGATAAIKLSTGCSNPKVHDNTVRKDGSGGTNAVICDIGAGNTYRVYENDLAAYGDVAATILATSGTRVVTIPTGTNVGQNIF